MKQAVILAGGKGTRLAQSLGVDIPKPMVPVCGVPLLERLVILLCEQGIKKVLLLVHYRCNVIRDHFGDGARYGVAIEYMEETEPRGTGGALLDALQLLEDRFIVLYGDTLVDLDFSRMVSFHRKTGADLTLFAHPNDHPQDSDLIERAGTGQVTAVYPYPHPEGAEYDNLVNAALYVMEKNLLSSGSLPDAPFDIAKHGIPLWLADGRRVFGYRGDGYIKDMGTPERLAKVEAELQSGMVAWKSGRKPRPAVFMDRDGTLNIEKGHLSRVEDFELYPGVAGSIRDLNRMGVLSILITNQPVIARGEARFEDIDRIHRRLQTLLAQEWAYLDGIFLCPHHPDKGFCGELAEFKVPCECRKPSTGMIDQACMIWSIDRRRSFLIGDTTLDMECARRAGIPSILVQTGSAGRDGKYAAVPAKVVPGINSAIHDVLVELSLPNPMHQTNRLLQKSSDH